MTKSVITPYPLRLSPELRKKLEDHAKQVGRSLQSEIINRLELTFEVDMNQVFSSMNTRGVSLNYDELAEALMRKAEKDGDHLSINVVKKKSPPRSRARIKPEPGPKS